MPPSERRKKGEMLNHLNPILFLFLGEEGWKGNLKNQIVQQDSVHLERRLEMNICFHLRDQLNNWTPTN